MSKSLNLTMDECVDCGSTAISAELGPEFLKSYSFSQSIKCQACNAEWLDIYVIKDQILTQEGSTDD